MKTNNTYLHFVAYKELGRWDVQNYLLTSTIHSAYTLVKLNRLISPQRTIIKKEDYIGSYSIVEKIAFKTGQITFREENKTGMDLCLSHLNELLVSSINFHQGAVAVNTFGDIVASTHYKSYHIDISKVLPSYLVLVLRSPYFLSKISASRAQGIKNESGYNVIGEYQIPLPSLAEQQALVDAYNHNLQQATELEQQAENGEKEIEDVIMQRLGITIPKIDTSKKGLSFVSYKDVQDRWDLYNAQTSIFTALAKSTYKAQQIGSIYNFITRGWKKTEDKFRYIELGSVDAADGIMSASELLVKDAPSRATQKVSEGDLILGTTRPYLKKFAIVPQEFADCVCSSGFQVIANNSTNNLQFLYEYLKTPAAIAQYEYFMTGALYPAITNADLKKVEIPLPPLDVQAEIVAEVQAQRAKIAEYKSTAATLRQEAITQFEQAIFE